MKSGKKSQKPKTVQKDGDHERITRDRVKRLQQTINNDLQSNPSGEEADNSTPQAAITLDYNRASLDFLEKYDTACKPKTLNYDLVQNRISVRVLESEFKRLQDFAAAEKIPHTTQRPKTAAPYKVVVRGLPVFIPTDDIKNFLSLDYKVDKVSRMTRFDPQSRTRVPIPLCLVSIQKDENSENILQVKNILRANVKIEKYIASNRPFQCFNCLDFGHGTEACHRPSVCSHCSGNHKYSDCDKEHLGRECINCLCSNCGGRHQANSVLCPRRSTPRTIQSKKPYTQNRDRPRRKRYQAQYEDRGSDDWYTPEEAPYNDAASQVSSCTPDSEIQQIQNTIRKNKASYNTRSAPQQRREKPYYNEQPDLCLDNVNQPEPLENITTASRLGGRQQPRMTYARAAASTLRNGEDTSPQQNTSPQQKDAEFIYVAVQAVLNEIKQSRNDISPETICAELLKLIFKARNASPDEIDELVNEFIKNIFSKPDTANQHGSSQP